MHTLTSRTPSGRTFGPIGRQPSRGLRLLGLGLWLSATVIGCSSSGENTPLVPGGIPSAAAPSATAPAASVAPLPTVPVTPPMMTGGVIPPPPPVENNCGKLTCASLGWKCGYLTDDCGDIVDCASEGLECASGEVCMGGIDTPTECIAAGGGSCELCSFLPDCEGMPQPTRLTGRVITPGRSDDNIGNQVGVPNALVYILQNNTEELPAIPVGIPAGGTACDRCEDQASQLGEVLFGAITDATGAFTIEQYVPVGQEFTLVVKAGKFRRGVRVTVPEQSACQTVALPTTLPDNPTRLPRNMTDGLFVNIPKIAVSTGQIDAMECVFEKLGLAHSEFSNPGAAADAVARVHLYRGGGDNDPDGAYFDDATPHNETLYGELARLQSYDMIVADCEGATWDQDLDERDASGANVREYVNRGGRMFASHLSFSWLVENGDAPYSEGAAIETGLGPAAVWDTNPNSNPNSGTGYISTNSPNASPRIDDFTTWLQNEGVVSDPENSFTILQPRSQVESLGENTEEFIHCQDQAGDAGGGGDCIGNAERIQQFSFNTPYGAPEEASCGRVAYSGFHVAAMAGGGATGPFADAVFPEHCTGDLTDQEKVLLYMLFDLGACVGEPPPPPECKPKTCQELNAECGHAADGCGMVLDCGACPTPVPPAT
jgi:hypothetical protein